MDFEDRSNGTLDGKLREDVAKDLEDVAKNYKELRKRFPNNDPRIKGALIYVATLLWNDNIAHYLEVYKMLDKELPQTNSVPEIAEKIKSAANTYTRVVMAGMMNGTIEPLQR